MLEDDLGFEFLQMHWIGRQGQRRIDIQYLKDSLCRRRAFLQAGIDFGQVFDRLVGLLCGKADDGQGGERNLVAVADHHEYGGQGNGQQLHGGMHHNIDKNGLAQGFEVFLIDIAET